MWTSGPVAFPPFYPRNAASTKPGSDRTGPDHGSDRGSDHRKKKRFKEKKIKSFIR